MKIINYPDETNPLWNQEVESILPWCVGRGLDIGSGARAPIKEQDRLDLDPECKPDYLASADDTKLPYGTFDYITATHILEHIENTAKALAEWVRITSSGGFICLVCPDREFTANRGCGPQRTMGKKLMEHVHEWNLAEFEKMLEQYEFLGYSVIDTGIAGENWSNYAILRKN